jgi:hypothetical protein
MSGKCACGQREVCAEPWEPECGLGKSAEHVRVGKRDVVWSPKPGDILALGRVTRIVRVALADRIEFTRIWFKPPRPPVETLKSVHPRTWAVWARTADVLRRGPAGCERLRDDDGSRFRQTDDRDAELTRLRAEVDKLRAIQLERDAILDDLAAHVRAVERLTEERDHAIVARDAFDDAVTRLSRNVLEWEAIADTLGATLAARNAELERWREAVRWHSLKIHPRNGFRWNFEDGQGLWLSVANSISLRASLTGAG